jgi:hypothetical protein
VTGLTDDERDLDVLIEAAHPSRPDRRSLVARHLERIVAARVQQARAEADTHREVAESMTGLWRAERDRADRLEAMCDRLAEKIVDLEDESAARVQQARAEALHQIAEHSIASLLPGSLAQYVSMRDVSRVLQDREAGQHHPNCYQRTGVPDDLPPDLCDCRVLRMIDREAGR